MATASGTLKAEHAAMGNHNSRALMNDQQSTTAHLMVANEECCGTLGVCSAWPGCDCSMLGAAIHPLLGKIGNAALAACMTGPLPRMLLHLLAWVCWSHYLHMLAS